MEVVSRVCVFLCAAVSFLCLGSCKEKDSVSPTVVIHQPLATSTYVVFDTVFIDVTVFDDRQLIYVDAKIVDLNFIAISSSTPITFGSNSNQGIAQLVIGNKLTETGDYYVLITASDGTNEQREYQKIKIIGLPKKRRAVYFGATTGLEMGEVWRVDSLFQSSSLWLQLNQDVSKLCVNSLNNRLNVIGKFSIGIESYSLESASLAWSNVVFSVAQTERYSDLYCFGNTVFTSIYDREVRAYNLQGALILNRPTGNFRPHTLYADEDYLLVEMELVGDNDYFIFVYSAQTLALLWQIDLPMDIVSICQLRTDEVLLFGNDAGTAKVLHYDIGDNAYWQPRQLPEGRLQKATKMDGQMFAIAHDNGLYVYTYSPNYLNLVRPGTLFQDLSFDVDKRTIIGASRNMLQEISANGQLINTVVNSDSITSVNIHYTR